MGVEDLSQILATALLIKSVVPVDTELANKIFCNQSESFLHARIYLLLLVNLYTCYSFDLKTVSLQIGRKFIVCGTTCYSLLAFLPESFKTEPSLSVARHHLTSPGLKHVYMYITYIYIYIGGL